MDIQVESRESRQGMILGRLPRRAIFLFLMLGVLTGVSFAQTVNAQPNLPNALPNQISGPISMKMKLEGERVTAEIRNVPLQQVLEDFAARSGVVFEVGLQDNLPISLNLDQVGLQEAIQRIFGGSSNVILYYGRAASGTTRIQFVRAFSRTPKPPQPSLRYIGTGSITKRGDDTVDSPAQALKVLMGGESLQARQQAVEALVAAKGDVAIQALTNALVDVAPEVRAAAIEGLASLGARSALPRIVQALKDAHPGVRQSAILAVALLGDVRNLRDLQPLGRDEDASVAAAAEIAIRNFRRAVPK